MMEWWVKKGVDGFRVDAISYLDKPQDFPDSAEPPQPDGYSFSSSLINGVAPARTPISAVNEPPRVLAI